MELDLLETRLNHSDNDLKIESLNKLKLDLIEINSIDIQPEIERLNTLLKLSLKSNNVNILTSTLICLPLYFNLILPVDEASEETPTFTTANINTLKKTLTDLLPFDKLGDSKEKVRDLVKESIISAGIIVLKLGITVGNSTTANGKEKEGPWSYVSRLLIESFTSKNIKVREQILSALRNQNLTPTLAPLKPFTPSLLHLLSDSDPSIRALALSTTISIFSSPSVNSAAKSDLKKEMIKLDIKEKIQESILSSVLGSSTSESVVANEEASEGVGSQGESTITSAPLAQPKTRPLPTTRSTSASFANAADAALQPETVPVISTEISPVYIPSLKDLNTEFENMKVGFEGKETEFNWMIRDKHIARIRGMLRGNVKEVEFLDGFLGGIKSVQEGITKTASSLRTTLATSALALITELSYSLGVLFDPFLEVFLSHTLSMAGQTKKLVATASQAAVTALLTNSNYHLKTIQLIWTGMNDKIVLARTFISSHLITFIKIHGLNSKTLIESSGGIDILEQCLKKGLTDANPIVKENTRTSYWLLKELFPKMTEKVLATLDVTSTKQLDKSDPSKKIGATTTTTSTTASTSTSTSTGKSGRPSMRDMIALAKAGTKLNEEQEVLGNEKKSGLSSSTNTPPSSGLGNKRKVMDRNVSAPNPTSTSFSSISNDIPLPVSIPVVEPELEVDVESNPTPSSPPKTSSPSPKLSPRRKSYIPISPKAPHNTLKQQESKSSIKQTPIESTPIVTSISSNSIASTSSILNSPSGKSLVLNEEDTNNLMFSPPPFIGDNSDDEQEDLKEELVSEPKTSDAKEEEEEEEPISSPESLPPPPLPPKSPLQVQSSHNSPTIPSSASKPKPTPTKNNQPQRSLDLPITESIVDEALLAQARQAELTAERLLEIGEDERINESTPKKAFGGRGGINTPISKRVIGGDVFEDSPDPKGKKGTGKNWWMKKAESIFSVFPSSSSSSSSNGSGLNKNGIIDNSSERLNLIDSKISALRSHQIDITGLKLLSNISKERYLNDDEDDVEVEEEDIDRSITSKAFWSSEGRFEKMFEGLSGFLLDEKVRDRREAALVVLKNIVQYQFPNLSGDEAGFFKLILKLREDPSRSIVAAVETIADVFCNRLEPLYGLGILRISLTSYLGPYLSTIPPSSNSMSSGIKSSFGLGLRMMGSFFERLPVEILEEELPKVKELIKLALNDSQSGDLRRAAVNSLVSVQSVLRNETKLYSILDGGLGKDQLNLLSYYFAKLPKV